MRLLTSTLTPTILLCLLITTLPRPSIGDDTLTSAQSLDDDDDGKTLISAGGSFALGFFSPTGTDNRYVGIWYNKISVCTAVWVANRLRPLTNRHGSLKLLANGTLEVTDENSTVLWSSTSSAAVRNPVAQLLDDGNLVVRSAADDESNASFAWQSFDYPTDSLLPGMKVGWNLTTGFNRQLSSWTSTIDPAPGDFTLGIDLEGDPQLLEWSSFSSEQGTKQPKWRGGPWNGLGFSGIPQMQSYNMFSLRFTADDQEVVYWFEMLDPTFVSRLVVNQSGALRRVVWVENDRLWNPIWESPVDWCDDEISPCGQNGVCDAESSLRCACVTGFRPANPTSWNLRDGTDGCARKTALDCKNGTDGFFLLRGVKLPDTSRSTVDWSTTVSAGQCRARCLGDCSCTAYAQANISGRGSGCITWTGNLTDLRLYGNGGQELYVRLAAADLRSGSRNVSFTVVIVILSILATLSLALVVYCIWRRRRRRRRRRESEATRTLGMSHSILLARRQGDEGTEANNLEISLFSIDEVVNATDNFSVMSKLGEGGFGSVYKGKLGEEQLEVAMKRLSRNSMQGVDEFKNEITLIAKLQHRNLVRLIGYCIQKEERILIYEFMNNGSLHSFIFDKVKGALLNWTTRYNIIVGIARGLLYLHEDSRFRIIHRDLKASNVLLDKEMNPKISDFGMARIFKGDETEVNTKRVVGTYGYMSPEYAMDGIFSVKSDVFSFGVLVLEIISGKKNRGIYNSTYNLNLLGYTWSLWKEGNGLKLVDESIGYSFPKAEILKCVKIALLCVQEYPQDRPTMSTILLMMGTDIALIPQPRQPGFVGIRGPNEINSSSGSNHDSLSINNLSITAFEGR
ncbi:receptor-like serine/threonine-protein kinase SD1-8 isoform X2 [Zingiber officinale]|uniref:receptor-like serine/threonine-protein kinase SD1-8 isoform X2 n=1 Tax=Zingiber officinale TaxID=94328 RepID=UPI001C4B33B7|nr:receptor-like serine/threonine-protein kinase SD1-8 isoform X2 [Zingiber officinale]